MLAALAATAAVTGLAAGGYAYAAMWPTSQIFGRTVIAGRDCYMVEFLRHILEAVHRDPVYKSRSDAIYLKRVFELQLRKMSICSDISKQEFEEIRNNV